MNMGKQLHPSEPLVPCAWNEYNNLTLTPHPHPDLPSDWTMDRYLNYVVTERMMHVLQPSA